MQCTVLQHRQRSKDSENTHVQILQRATSLYGEKSMTERNNKKYNILEFREISVSSGMYVYSSDVLSYVCYVRFICVCGYTYTYVYAFT